MLSFFRKKSESDMTTTNTTSTSSTVRNSNNSTTTSGKLEQTIVGDGQINNTKIIQNNSNPSLEELGYNDAVELRETIYDILRTIKDPEKPSTLEDLNVVYEQGIFIQNPTSDNVQVIRVEFNPTVPHCSLATLIGLCIRIKIERNIPHKLKLDIYIKKGAHSTEDEINKQINDKERIAAAMENPNLRDLVEQCIKEEE